MLLEQNEVGESGGGGGQLVVLGAMTGLSDLE